MSTPAEQPEPTYDGLAPGQTDIDEDGLPDLPDVVDEESYVYERVIDALIAFVSRFLRTASLMLFSWTRAESALLDSLDDDTPHYMRPMAFVALTYLVLVFVASAVSGVDAGMFSAAMQLALGSLGDADQDVLLIAILVPLPLVLIVAAGSHLAAARVADAGLYARARLAGLLQYAVAHGLWALIAWLLMLFAGSKALLAASAAVEATSGGGDTRVLGGVLALLFFGLLGLALLAVIAVPFLAVYRTVPETRGLPQLSRARRAALGLQALATAVTTLATMGGLVYYGASNAEAEVRFHVTQASLGVAGAGPSLDGVAVVTTSGEEPSVLLEAVGMWDPLDRPGLACAALEVDAGGSAAIPEGFFLGESAERRGHRATVTPDGSDGGQVRIEPGESAWVRFSLPTHAAPEPGDGTEPPALTWCIRSSADPDSWVATRS